MCFGLGVIKYGSECILKIPEEELVAHDENIDVSAVIQGIINSGIKTINIDNVLNIIPDIGDILIHKSHDERADIEDRRKPKVKVLGYSTHCRKLRGSKRRSKSEFAIRVRDRWGERWIYVDEITHYNVKP